MMTPDKTDDYIAECMQDLNDLQTEYDARILAAVCMSKASFLYRQLRQFGIESPESLTRIFQYGLDGALKDGPTANIQNEAGMPLSTRKN